MRYRKWKGRGQSVPAAFALICASACGVAHADDEAQAQTQTTAEIIGQSGLGDWRRPDPRNTLYLELETGMVVIELAPAFAPQHVANIRTLVRQRYFDGLFVLRSQDNYVVQWGDPGAEGSGVAAPGRQPRSLGEARAGIPPEFDRPVSGLDFTKLPDGDAYAPEVGYSKGFPAARDAATGRAWLAHCYGMLGAGRGNAADSGSGAELYVVIGHSPRHLDRNVTLVGRVLLGMERLSVLPRGNGPLGFYEDPARFVAVRSIRLAAEVPPEKRIHLQVFRTDTPAFGKLIESRRHRREEWFLHSFGKVGLCNVPIPVRQTGASVQAGIDAKPDTRERALRQAYGAD